MADARAEAVEKIRRARAEMQTSGPIHRRDLQRQINRLQKELRCYDRYHRGWLKLQKASTQSG